MKKVLFVFCVLSGVCSFSQQKDKLVKRMLEQIAANKVYVDYLEKGYQIAHDGLATIRAIKDGDFHLHLDYFQSLKTVNPAIRKWTKIADIVSLQLQIIKESHLTLQGIRQAGQFTNDESDYCASVFTNLLTECGKDIDALIAIITDGRTGMKDDERMKIIDQVFSDMQDKYSFVSSFSNEMGILSVQRISEQADIDYSKKLNNINP